MGGPPILHFFKGFLLLLGCFDLFFIVVELFLDIFWLFWVFEGVAFDDFDWDPILGSLWQAKVVPATR